jgi:ring-1,2-phenylacetyl-CoA epoxidase subunit PaaC
MHEDDNAYESLAAASGGEERWAFGTGFDDPLAGIDTTVPADIDGEALAEQCLAMGDDALVMAQRLGLWCSNAPELEDELALANIALDLLGQARKLLTRAAQAAPSLRPREAPAHIPDEDALAYFREADAFRSTALAALDARDDFGVLIVQLSALTEYRIAMLDSAILSKDPVLSAIAAKGRIEAAYHREYATGWLVRLGDGTDESHKRMISALNIVWPCVPDFDDQVLREALATATLDLPMPQPAAEAEHLAPLIDEMQSLARAIPEATW